MTGTDTAAPTVLTGCGVGRGIVIGPVARFVHSVPLTIDEAPLRTEGEQAEATARATEALARVRSDLETRAANAEGALRAVLEATAGMTADPGLEFEIKRRISSGVGPVTAINDAVGTFIDTFTQMGGLMAERVTDLVGVRDRVISDLLGVPAPGLELAEPSVVVATDLAPADTAGLDLSLVIGIVLEEGGPTGHTAIIANQLGLPCVVGTAGADALQDGDLVGIDSASGQVFLTPDAQTIDMLDKRAAAEVALRSDLAPGATADGHRVDLLANIGTVADAERAAASGIGAAGSGLFRTEVLFLDRRTAPSAAEQSEAYLRVMEAFAGRKVVVRTLDAGADKPLAFATQKDEPNPALGVRAFRLARVLPDLIEEQFRALGLVADALPPDDRGLLWVMAPMVATPSEARQVAELARAHGLEKVGVMIEVPSAALMAQEILAEVDFVSIGSNDLAQYTMATDRLSHELADLLDIWQPAVLRLIAQVARAGMDLGKPVGVCGESASDPLMALVLTGLGITSLSMSPTALPAVRFALRRHSLAACEAMANAAVSAADPAAARAAVLTLLDDNVAHTLGMR